MNTKIKGLSQKQKDRLNKAIQASYDSGQFSMRAIGSYIGICEERVRQLLNKHGMDKYLKLKAELSNRRRMELGKKIEQSIRSDLDSGVRNPLTFYVKKLKAKPELIKLVANDAEIKFQKIIRSKLELSLQVAEARGLCTSDKTMKEIAEYLKDNGLGTYSLSRVRSHLHRYGRSYKKIYVKR